MKNYIEYYKEIKRIAAEVGDIRKYAERTVEDYDRILEILKFSDNINAAQLKKIAYSAFIADLKEREGK